MKVINYEVLTNAWIALSMGYGNQPISSAEFKELCKKRQISISNGMKNAYEEARVITCPSRGQVVISSCITKQQVIEACAIVRDARKKYKDGLEGVHAFNLRVEARVNPDFTPEACVKYLQSLGYVVYKPTKGERVVAFKDLYK